MQSENLGLPALLGFGQKLLQSIKAPTPRHPFVPLVLADRLNVPTEPLGCLPQTDPELPALSPQPFAKGRGRWGGS